MNSDEIIKSINDKVGKGSMMKLSGKPDFHPYTSSGSLGLDLALGIGGYPEGRIIEIYGPESSGKCLTEDAYIQTPNGFKTVEEIFKENNLEMLISSKQVECSYPLINRYGEIENTTHLVYNGKRDLYKIETHSGFSFKRTPKHPLLVMSKYGNLVWRWTSEIKEGDYLVNHRNTYFGNKKEDLDLCYSIGILIADGCFSGIVSVTNNDPCIKKFIEDKMIKSLGFGGFKKELNSDNCEEHSFTYKLKIHAEGEKKNKKLQSEFYDKFDLKEVTAKDKYFPKWVRELDKESMSSVIRGYLDCESYINKTGLEVTSASKELLYQLKLMLSQFGINCLLSEFKGHSKYKNNNYYVIYIYGEDFETYLNEIGTNSKYREKQIQQFIDERANVTQIQTNYKHIPFVNELVKDLYHEQDIRDASLSGLMQDVLSDACNITFTRLEKILDNAKPSDLNCRLRKLLNFQFEKVKSISRLDEKTRTFDFAMESTSSFTADGCINHNTTLTIHAIAEWQKKGRIGAMIDAEHAFDKVYAQSLGVDIDNMLISQPSSGEEALEIADSLLDVMKDGIIVVDSVAALVPQAEIDGEMGDNKMGLHSRLMSQAMRKITARAAKSNNTIIFINQIRDKIGVMFGSPETTTGGNALKFYASVRLDIRRQGQSIKDKDGDAIANKVKVKVIKNKMAPPFKEAEFEIEFGIGISKVGEIIDIAEELDIIKKSGSWYSYNDAKISQGRDAAKKFLLDNPELSEEIEKKIKAKIYK